MATACPVCRRDIAPAVTPAKRGTNPLVLLFALIGGVFVLVCFILPFLAGLFGDSDNSGPTSPTSRPRETARPSSYYVLYKITGTGRAGDVTYENGEGGTEQADISIPWQKGETMEYGDFVYISAQSGDDANRTITCEIRVNGDVFKTSTSTGRYVIASCSGSVGRD